MEKKQNDLNVKELTLDQMDKVSGGAGTGCDGEQSDEPPYDPSAEFVPGKKGTRRDPTKG